MAARKPLVLNSGQIEQLQSGDTLNAIVSGGDNFNLENTQGSAIGRCFVVYSGGGTGQIKLARANASGTAKAIGLVNEDSIANGSTGNIMLAGVMTPAGTAFWDDATGGSGGLTPNAVYYLSEATAGMMTTTPPTTGWVQKIGIALTDIDFWINIEPAIKL